MQDLQVVGVESGSLVVVSEDGTRYRVPIDDALRAKLRQNVPEPGTAPRLSPKEIQAQIRSGMSAQDVAGLTGAPLEYIQRFEGPVMAEREFVVQSAFGVPVRVAGDTGQLGEGRTFGTAIRERLHDIGAIGERWSSWKEEASGWVVKLSFTANHIDHDARWQFDHKKHSLVPLNAQAISLSRGEPAAPVFGAWLIDPMTDITALGGYTALTLLTVGAALYYALQKNYASAGVLTAAIASSGLLTHLLKQGIDRLRPDLVDHLTHSANASFPSGHALQATVAFLIIGALAAQAQQCPRIRALIYAAAILLTLLVGISRVYLGVHWPTDVLAGWCLGTAWAALCWPVLRRVTAH